MLWVSASMHNRIPVPHFKKILLADDEPDIAQIIKMWLERNSSGAGNIQAECHKLKAIYQSLLGAAG